MTIASEITRLQWAKADIKTAIEWKWVTVPSSAKIDSYDDYIDAIQSWGWWWDIYTTWSTFTVTYAETSSPAFSPTYSDDAAWLTAGSPEFDAFFWYSAVRLNEDWKETAEVLQWKAWTLDITKLWTLTSWDNVMIKFPVRWIKMTKSWTTVTLSITSELNKTWYQYYAFNRNWIIKPYLYLWAYKSARITDWNLKKLKSWSWQWAATSDSTDWISYISLSDTTTWARAMAHNNDWWTWIWWYDEITWYARNYINALYMMKYCNWDWQTTIWRWYVDSNSAAIATWWTNQYKNATWWETTWKYQMKLFWLEDRWWNVYEWLDWAFYTSTTNINVSSTNILTNTSWSTSSAPFDTNITIWSSWNYLKYAVWTNEWMFAPTDRSWSNSTYYCDSFGAGSGGGLRAGGNWGVDSGAGPFFVGSTGVSYAGSSYGARLMFL